jgi:hypothetical protein
VRSEQTRQLDGAEGVEADTPGVHDDNAFAPGVARRARTAIAAAQAVSKVAAVFQSPRPVLCVESPIRATHSAQSVALSPRKDVTFEPATTRMSKAQGPRQLQT